LSGAKPTDAFSKMMGCAALNPIYALMSFVKVRDASRLLQACSAGVDRDDDRATVGARPETSVIKL
jgi:hypothetical protein